MQHLFVISMGLLSLLYLLNPSMGVFEIIPDNFPVFGNLDEATATALLLASLRYYGLDLTAWFRRGKPLEQKKKSNQLDDRP